MSPINLAKCKDASRSFFFVLSLLYLTSPTPLRSASTDAQLNLLEQMAARSGADAAPLTREQQDAFLLDAAGQHGEPSQTFQIKKLFSLGLGYDSNPGAAPSAHGSWFAKPDLNLSLGWTPDAADIVVVGYDVSGTIYDGASSTLDQAVNTFDVNWNHLFSQDSAISLDAKDVATFIGTKAAQNKGDFIASFGQYCATHAWKFTAQYEYANLDQLTTPSKPSRDLTGNQHSVGPTLAFAPADVSLGSAGAVMHALAKLPLAKVELGFYHAWNAAVGSDNDYEGNKVTLSFTGIRVGVKRLTLNISYSHEWRNYTRPNSFSSTGALRNDGIDRASTEIDYNPLAFESLKLKLFVKYDLAVQDSNIEAKAFRDNIIQAGFSLEF
jgi:hypothetical protein